MSKCYFSRLLLVFISVIGFSASVFSQNNATIRGFIYDENGESLPGATILLTGTDVVEVSDGSGFFSLSRLKPGEYSMRIKYFGYTDYIKQYTLNEGQVLNVTIELVPFSNQISDVEISAESQTRKEDTRVSQITVRSEDIKSIPSVGGEADITQYLTAMVPGVVTTGDQGGQLYIRGGAPVQNKVLLDGMVIYNPFHSIGLFSVFDTEIIKSAEIYTGGFGAQYGGRISSVMDISTRDGNKKRFSGRVGVTPFTAKALFEGPFAKFREDRPVSASFLLSAKGSFLEQSSKVLYPYAGERGLPFNFWDIYGKVSVFADKNGSRLNLFGFTYNDKVNYSDLTDLQWKSFGGGANFIVIPGVSNVRIDGVFSYSSYEIALTEEIAPPRTSKVNGFNFGINFQQFFGASKIFYGIEALGYTTDFSFINAENRKISQEENTTEFAAFFRYKFNKWGLVLEPSLRVHYYASLDDVSIEPRLSAKYNFTDWFRIKLAGGLYSQNLIAANSDRDVVNLFYGFLSGSENIPKQFRGEDVNHRLQKSQHAIFGVEFDISKYVTINAEGYYINFGQLLGLNRNKQYDDNGANANVPDELKKDFIIERGYAAGADFNINFKYKNLSLWVIYSYMKTERTDEVVTYSPHFDRTHNINLVANYRFGKTKTWEVSARWNFGSGFPFTQTQGYYEFLDFQSGIFTDYTSANGTLGIQYAEINQGRLPYYHRFDVNVRKIFQFKKNLKLELNAGATNIYNRENIFYIDRVTFKRINQLPIIPTIGISFEF